jgi:hypothetical protein
LFPFLAKWKHENDLRVLIIVKPVFAYVFN